MTSLRDIHERVKTRHAPYFTFHGDECSCCHRLHPCPDYDDAVAALTILDQAAFGFDIDHGWREDRLIPDPGKNPELKHEALLEEILLRQERMFGETGPLP